MKKFMFLVSCMFVLVGITGCGNTKVLECTNRTPGNNMSATSDVKYVFKNDKLSKIELEIKFGDISIDNLSSHWDDFVSQFTEQNEPVTAPGYKRTVKADNKNYTFTVFIDVDYDKISEDTMDKYGVEDYSSKSYDEIKEKMVSESNMTCK